MSVYVCVSVSALIHINQLLSNPDMVMVPHELNITKLGNIQDI